MTAVDTPRPLPECSICGTPTARRPHRANAGLCTPCRRAYDASRPQQQTLLLPLDGVRPEERLSNVVLLADRRRRR